MIELPFSPKLPNHMAMSTPLDTKEFMAEVNAQMQQERLLHIVKRGLPFIIAIILIMVLAGVGISYWKNKDAQIAEAQTAQLLQWSDAPHTASTAEQIIRASNAWSGPRAVLAKLIAAGQYRAANQPNKADEILAQLAKNTDAAELSDYAVLNNPTIGTTPVKLHSKVMQQAADEVQAWQHYASAATPDAQNQAKAELQKLAQQKDLPAATQQRLLRIQD